MVGSTVYSLSPSSSSSSLADDSVTAGVIKYLCSYGGKILPRYPDGKLRYVGGETRVLAVDRSLLLSGMFFLSVISSFLDFQLLIGQYLGI